MTTMLDLAKRLAKSMGKNSGSSAGATSNNSSTRTYGVASTDSYVRYGTVVSLDTDSTGEEDHFHGTVQLDPGDTTIDFESEMAVYVGDRVQIMYKNGNVIVVSMAGTTYDISETNLRIDELPLDEIEATAEDAATKAADALAAAQTAESQISEASAKADAAAAAASGISDILTKTPSELADMGYTATEVVDPDTGEVLYTEITDENGNLVYTTQSQMTVTTADGLTSTVTANVMNSQAITNMQTQISQNATSITSAVSGSTTYTAPDGTTQTNTLASKITQSLSSIGITFSDDSPSSTLIRLTASGVEVGQSTDGGTTYSGPNVLLSSTGAIQLRDENQNALSTWASDAITLGKSSSNHVTINANGAYIYDSNSNAIGTFTGTGLTLGNASATGNRLVVNTSGWAFYNSSGYVTAQMSGSTLQLGSIGATSNYMQFSNSGIDMLDSNGIVRSSFHSDYIQLGNGGDGSTTSNVQVYFLPISTTTVGYPTQAGYIQGRSLSNHGVALDMGTDGTLSLIGSTIDIATLGAVMTTRGPVIISGSYVSCNGDNESVLQVASSSKLSATSSSVTISVPTYVSGQIYKTYSSYSSLSRSTSNRQEVLYAKCLFYNSSGAAAASSLSESMNNFKLVTIIYQDSGGTVGKASQTVNPGGYTNLFYVKHASTTSYTGMGFYSGTTSFGVLSSVTGQMNHPSGGNHTGSSTTNPIKIIAIIGWR